jgi:hypothetical protein
LKLHRLSAFWFRSYKNYFFGNRAVDIRESTKRKIQQIADFSHTSFYFSIYDVKIDTMQQSKKTFCQKAVSPIGRLRSRPLPPPAKPKVRPAPALEAVPFFDSDEPFE